MVIRNNSHLAINTFFYKKQTVCLQSDCYLILRQTQPNILLQDAYSYFAMNLQEFSGLSKMFYRRFLEILFILRFNHVSYFDDSHGYYSSIEVRFSLNKQLDPFQLSVESTM